MQLQPFQMVMLIITTLLSIYSFIIFIKIILSWIPVMQLEGIKRFLGAIVDPYLNLFRGIRWLQFGMLDFSPVIGLILLSVTANITGRLAASQTITVGSILSLLIGQLWSFIAFMLGILIVLLVVRLIVSLVNGNSYNSWGNLDSMIYNLMSRVVGLFTQKSVTFHGGLLITIGVLVVLRVGFGFLIRFLMPIIARI